MSPRRRPEAPADPVLVVDDEPGIRALIAESLLADGFAVLEAEGGDHALRLLATETFCAVVLDRSMPGLDGIEVLHWIRRTPATAMLPVLLVTGHDEVDDIVEGLGVGADDYVVKPFEPGELVARVRSHLRGRAGWSEIVQREVERRAALTDAARAAGSAGPLDQAAMQLCDGLLQLPGALGVALVELIGDGVVPVAAKGEDPLDLLVREGGAHAVGRHLAHRARSGAWLEPTVQPVNRQSTAIAAAPVLVDQVPVALVLVTPEPTASRETLDQLLAVAIDFAALAGGLFGTALRDSAARDVARQRFVTLVERHDFATVFQPVVDLLTQAIVGYEALTRFDTDDTESVFTGAALVGAGRTVELRTLEAAIEESRRLPADAWLSVNVSPTLAVTGSDFADLIATIDDRPLVVEISELEPVHDHHELRAAIDRLGAEVTLSVDDAGSGFAGLSRILALGAEYVKIDQSWVRDIHLDPAKRALVSGIQNFATETSALVVAEGIETEEELEAVRRLGIALGQGFLLGRPEAA